MEKIALSSFKGGTGKSALAVLLTNAYAGAGKRVLVIDLDHQRNTTSYYQTNPQRSREANVAEAFHRGTLEGNVTPSHIIGVDLVAGSFGILQQRAASTRTLARLLEPVRDAYDVVVVDCPPTLDGIVLNAWGAADRIVTPARVDGHDYDGVAELGDAIELEAPDKRDSWVVVLNFYRPPRGGEGTLDFDLDGAFSTRYPNLSPYRIPEAAAIARVVHGGETITTAKRTRSLYDAIEGLAGDLIGERIDVGGSI